MATKKPSLSKIRSRFERELDAVLKEYFGNGERLSKRYWPKSIRLFLHGLINALLDTEVLLTKLSICDQLPMRQILLELEKGTKHYFTVASRKYIWDILLKIKSLALNIKIPTHQSVMESNSYASWPTDIAGLPDLSDTVCANHLRRDVEGFLTNIIMNIVCDSPFKITFCGVKAEQPIIVEVTEDHVHNVRELLKACGDGIDEFSPGDVVTVCALPDRDAVVKEEGLLSSGSPWHQGTLGAIYSVETEEGNEQTISDDSHNIPRETFLAASTCAHVSTTTPLGFESPLERDILFRAKSTDVDVAFFKIVGSTNIPPELIYNSHALVDMDINTKPGEVVFKIGGAATGNTSGRLRSMSASYTAPGKQIYSRCVEVEWEEDVTFASSGDCGALYCVKRGGAYVPIGIHRISGDRSSFGTSFRDAIDCFADGTRAVSFVNAPNSFEPSG